MTTTNQDPLEGLVQVWVNVFLERSDHPFQVTVLIHPTLQVFQEVLKKTLAVPVVTEKQGRLVRLHLARVPLGSIPLEALEGWIHQELALTLLQIQLGPRPFNFRKEFLPLFPVSGSGVNFIRQIVEQLKNGLDEGLATGMVLDLGLVEPLTHYQAYRLTATPTGAKDYRDTLPHAWIRAAYLCGRLREFMAVSFLARRAGGRGESIKTRWWRRYDFIVREDQALLEEIGALVWQQPPPPYSGLLIRMFTLIRGALLTRYPRSPLSSSLH